MTRKEMYEALAGEGVTLKSLNSYSLEALQNMYREHFGEPWTAPVGSEPQGEPEGTEPSLRQDEPAVTPDENEGSETQEESVEPRTLEFNHSGWCDELGTSYFQGYYSPKTVQEYLILRKYAEREL